MIVLRKTLLAASALALMSTPAWALPSQARPNRGAGHAQSTTSAGGPATIPNDGQNPGNQGSGRANGHSPGDHPGAGTSPGSGSGDQGTSSHPSHPSHPGHPNHPAHPSHPGHPGHPSHPGHPHHPDHPGRPGNVHKCVPHGVAYIARGTLVSQTLSENPDGTYSGTVTVDVTRTNRHAASDRGTTQTYTLTGARVKLVIADINNDGSIGLDDLQAGDRVKLIGAITTLAKRCNQDGFTATTTIRRIVFHMPIAR
jgi:hypothetical protein